MPNHQYAYDFDPHGTSEDNLVVNEYQSLSPVQTDEYHFIIPRRAPFYRDGFTITHVETGEELHEGVDFHFGHQFQAATLNTAKPVYGSVVFLRYDLAGNVKIDQYRTVGGPWTLDETTLTGILAQKQLNPRQTQWENVVNLPSAFPPVDHEFSVDDLVGMSTVVQSLDDIREAILQKAEEAEVDLTEYYSGYARQYSFPPIYETQTTWSLIGELSYDSHPTSDLVLLLSGAETINAVQSSVYMLTLGVELTTPPGGVTEAQAQLSVTNLSTHNSQTRFGVRVLPEDERVQVWAENPADRATLTATDLSRDHQMVFSPTVVLVEPVGIDWVDTFEIGRSPAQDSLKLGGYESEEYVRKDLMMSVMSAIQDTLDHLTEDPSNPGQTYPATYFVSRTQYTYAMNDFIADVQALTDHLNGETVTLPEHITEVPEYLDVPTGLPEFFIFRTEVTFSLQGFKDSLSGILTQLEDRGDIPSKQALLDRIDVGSVITIPFPGGSIEESTQEAAINYLSEIEFNQIMGEVMYVVNELIAVLNPS